MTSVHMILHRFWVKYIPTSIAWWEQHLFVIIYTQLHYATATESITYLYYCLHVDKYCLLSYFSI